jgi:endonuclease/exonuclease/phosphatase family metal-dependent hydrolase
VDTTVWSYNLRCDVEADGINAFSRRADYVFERLYAYAPDIIGFQEILPHMRRMLVDRLDGYTVAGTARGADYAGECCPIAFRSDKFELMSLETFWLSDTPDIPGSRYATDQSGCPRVCTEVMLRPLYEGGEPFYFYNTHLDHVGALARAQGASAVLCRIASRAVRSDGVRRRVVLTGDMNEGPEARAVKSLAAHLSDATASLGATYHGFGKGALSKIDYIFTNAPHRGAAVITDEKDGVYMSDHYPVSAVIDL